MKIVIFGLNEMAQLAHYYLSQKYEIAGFTVNRQYKTQSIFCNLPVVDFESITDIFPPSEHLMFAPIYAKNMNQFRKNIYQQCKDLNYRFISYISPYALTSNASIGENCFIFEGCNLQPFSEIGNNVIIWSYSHIGHHSRLEDNIFVSSHVVVCGKCLIEEFSFLGTNSTIRDQITVRQGTLIGQSASVTQDTESWRVYTGVPAKKTKQLSTDIY